MVLDFDETFTSYKQILNLRNISGAQVIEILESDDFKSLIEEMEKEEEQIN